MQENTPGVHIGENPTRPRLAIILPGDCFSAAYPSMDQGSDRELATPSNWSRCLVPSNRVET
jgi:hypothetical protein